MEEYSFLVCDGDEFEEKQCLTETQCFCVDKITGDRLGTQFRMRDEVSCNRKFIATVSRDEEDYGGEP